MTNLIQTTLTTIVAEYVNVELSDKSIRKLKIATKLAKDYTVCNIYPLRAIPTLNRVKSFIFSF